MGLVTDSEPADSAHDLLSSARRQLSNAGVVGPDAQLLLADALGESLGRVRMLEAIDAAVEAGAALRFRRAVDRRAAREPLQHIVGHAPFRFLSLATGPGALVPRPETELLAELAMQRLPQGGRVLDAGTGTGAIAVSIATERPDAEVIAVELSPAAFVWAKCNITTLAPSVRLLHDDFARALTEQADLDVLVSNPPYVPFSSIPRDPEVFLHDPGFALYSGSDGLDAIRQLSISGHAAVRSGGSIVLEHTEDQGERIRELLAQDGWQQASTSEDLSGRPRFTAAVRP